MYKISTCKKEKQVEDFFNEYKFDPISFVDSRFFFPNIDIN